MSAAALVQSQSSGASYRLDPYSFNPFVVSECAVAAAAAAGVTAAAKTSKRQSPVPTAAAAPLAKDRVLSSAGFALPVPASVAAAKAKSLTIDTTHHDDGVSEASSETDGVAPAPNPHNSKADHHMSPLSATLSVEMAAPAPALFRYASLNFRFGSAWFLAPFRTFVGDMVVVQYPSNGSTHMGLVSSITTVKPTTFYSEDNTDPNFLNEDDIAVLPRLLRHARDFDRETKLDLRSHDLRSLASAQGLAEEMGAPVTFLDAEWLLDLSAVTFLVHVHGEVALVDRLADELAAQEGAEVVFTYPATN